MNAFDAVLDRIDTALKEWDAVKNRVGATTETIIRGRNILSWEKFKQRRDR